MSKKQLKIICRFSVDINHSLSQTIQSYGEGMAISEVVEHTHATCWKEVEG